MGCKGSRDPRGPRGPSLGHTLTADMHFPEPPRHHIRGSLCGCSFSERFNPYDAHNLDTLLQWLTQTVRPLDRICLLCVVPDVIVSDNVPCRAMPGHHCPLIKRKLLNRNSMRQRRKAKVHRKWQKRKRYSKSAGPGEEGNEAHRGAASGLHSFPFHCL